MCSQARTTPRVMAYSDTLDCSPVWMTHTHVEWPKQMALERALQGDVLTHLGSSRRRSVLLAQGSRCGWRSGTLCAHLEWGPRNAGGESVSGSARCRLPASPGRTGPSPRARPGATAPRRPALHPAAHIVLAPPPGLVGGRGPHKRLHLGGGKGGGQKGGRRDAPTCG